VIKAERWEFLALSDAWVSDTVAGLWGEGVVFTTNYADRTDRIGWRRVNLFWGWRSGMLNW
jgi:hypothetical protein